MPLLSDTRHEKFAQMLAQGLGGTEAYHVVYPEAKSRSASTLAIRLRKRKEIQARVAELQATAATETVCTLAEKREILSRIIRDPKETTATVIRAIQVDNEMAGHNEAKELIHSAGEGLDMFGPELVQQMASAFMMRLGTPVPRPSNPKERNEDPP